MEDTNVLVQTYFYNVIEVAVAMKYFLFPLNVPIVYRASTTQTGSLTWPPVL